jgi:glycosyltransferase involved in cell wall biosynthesis
MLAKQNNLISIIIVSLNTKNEFVKTLNSAYEQTYIEKEIIVIDGLSTDGTTQKIKKNKNKISKFIIKKDKNIYDAMNKGSKLASGNWIIFLNSGDIFFDKRVLSRIFNNLMLRRGIIFGDTVVAANKNLKYIRKGKFFLKNTVTMPFCHQSAIVSAEIIKKNKFLINYNYSSDFDFFIKCFIKKEVFYKSNIIISTITANGLSDNNRQEVYNENIKILNKNNYNFLIILNLYLLKFLNFFKDIVKLVLPKLLIIKILELKYFRGLIRKNVN